MKILGIESSADETAAAVVANGTTILSSVVASQIDIHAEFGGMVPEVAARSHIEVILPVIQKALDQASCSWDDIDAIAVTYGPGLVGSLLIGVLAASTLAELKGKPLIPVNHIEAHAYAVFMMEHPPALPMLALTVSGGHTQLVLRDSHTKYTILGRTRDDAAGEAFDKVAKMIGLSYPGGPSIQNAALHGDDRAFALPKPQLGKGSLDFSFSGLKTAVLRVAQAAVGRDFRTRSIELPALLNDRQRYDIAASFQRVAVEILVDRVAAAADHYQPASIVVAGGVAASKALRAALDARFGEGVVYPPFNLCTDNAAMIASLGYFKYQAGVTAEPGTVAPDPVLQM